MFWNVTQSLLDGLLTTFQIFIFTLLFSLPFGLVLAFSLTSVMISFDIGGTTRFTICRSVTWKKIWLYCEKHKEDTEGQ